MTVDVFLRFFPFICMQHLFSVTSRDTWKVIWWIRRGCSGGNANSSMQLSVTSSSLSVTSTKLLWYRIFEIPGREKQRGFFVALSLPSWGFGFLFVRLTWSHPTAAHQPHWALAQRGMAPYTSPCRRCSLVCTETLVCLQRKSKGDDFFISCWKWGTDIHLCIKSHCLLLFFLLWE